MLTPNEHAGKARRVTKVERYGWTIKDEPGRLMMVPKDRLRVDDEYQRRANKAKVLAISRDFSWMAFGALIVADRGGEFFVIDGQHRAGGAMRRADITEVPCVVFRVERKADEAQGFLDGNCLRKPTTSADRFRALLVVGDPAATFVEKLLQADNRSATDTSSTKSAKCLTTLLQWAEKDRAAMERVWPVITDVCRGHGIHARIVSGLMYIETHLPAGVSLSDAKWRKRLVAIGQEALLSAAANAAVFFSKGGEGVWGRGMLEAINKGLRNRLDLAGAE